MTENKCKQKKHVWFKCEVREEYDKLKKEGYVVETFPEFVRAAYYDKLNKIKLAIKQVILMKHEMNCNCETCKETRAVRNYFMGDAYE